VSRIIELTAILLAVTTLALLATGCPDDDGGGPSDAIAINQQSATAAANANLRSILSTVAEGLVFLNDFDLVGDMLPSSVECAGTTSGEGDVDSSCVEEGPDFDLSEEVDDVADWVAENLFNEANVESSTETSVTYRVPAELLCGASESSGGSTFPIDGAEDTTSTMDDSEVDPECVETLNQFPIRLAVSQRSADNLDVDLLVGQERYNPVELQIYTNQLGIEIDLAQLRAALIRFGQVVDEPLELPEVMQGRLSATLTVEGQGRFSVSLAVLTAVDVRSTSGEAPFEVSLGTANPAGSVTIDGLAETIEGALALGPLAATFPAEAVFGSEMTCDDMGCTESGASGTLSIYLAGLSAATTLDGSFERIELRNLGLGSATSTVGLDGQQLLAIDLNADSGRQLDVTVEGDESGFQLSVSPELDLQVALDMARAGGNIPDVPAWMLDDDMRLELTGASTPAIAMSEVSDTGVVRVTEGVLRMSSSARDLLIEVSAGECLWGDDSTEGGGEGSVEDDDWHPMDGLLSGLCPE
jgi:hypothetical protein